MLNRDFIQRKTKLIQEDLAKLEPIAQYSYAKYCDYLLKFIRRKK